MSAFAGMLATIYADPNMALAATLTLATLVEHPLTVIDKTAGVEVDLGGVGMLTVRPGACVRAAELAERGIAADDLDDATLTLGGADWRIAATQPRPSPGGIGEGEYLLVLEARS